jgi:glycosyltransferase involved in cell wall biosynthesis
MKVLQVLPRIAAQSSGPSYSVTRLSEALVQAGCEVELNVLEPLPTHRPSVAVKAYPTWRLPGAHRLGWAPSMKKGMMESARGADIVHNHSLWMMPNIYCHAAARRGGCKLVFSPRGTLSEWSLNRSSGRKKLVWLAGQRAALFAADCLHATSEKELQEMRAVGLRQPVAVIPNGVDVPQLQHETAKVQPRTVLFLSRLHPAKNVDSLLKAWRVLETQFPEWRLQIAGPLAGDYPRQMQQLARSLGLARADFLGEVAGARKSDLLAAAELFVLPTNSENFGIAVAEALAHATPVIVTRGAPWGGVERHRCGWWIEQGQTSLRTAMSTAMALLDAERSEMGKRGRTWMENEFAWTALGRRMLETYAWLMGQAAKPAWVAA